MKKTGFLSGWSLLLIAASLMMTGCTDQLASSDLVDDGIEGAPVEVEADFVTEPTRGVYIQKSSQYSKFSMFGVYNGTLRWNDVVQTKQADGTWKASKATSWPTKAMDAFAILPGSDAPVVSNIVMKKPTGGTADFTKSFEYEVPDSNKHQVDLMYASALNITSKTYGGKVKLTFKHGLSMLRFYIRLLIADIDVTVKSVSLHNVRTSGKFEFNKKTNSSGTWVPSNEKWGKVTQVFGEPVDLQYNMNLQCSGDSMLFLLPKQTTTAWVSRGTGANSVKLYQSTAEADAAHDSYLEVVCKISKDNGSGGKVYLRPDYSGWQDADEWVSVYFAYSKKTWNAATTNNVNIKFDVPYDANGNPIELPPYTPTTNLGYSVTIEEDWTDDSDNSMYIGFVDNN